MLAQGEFRRLLQANTKERLKIFQSIFHTERYETLQQRLRAQALAAKSTCDELRRSVQRDTRPAASAARMPPCHPGGRPAPNGSPPRTSSPFGPAHPSRRTGRRHAGGRAGRDGPAAPHPGPAAEGRPGPRRTQQALETLQTDRPAGGGQLRADCTGSGTGHAPAPEALKAQTVLLEQHADRRLGADADNSQNRRTYRDFL